MHRHVVRCPPQVVSQLLAGPPNGPGREPRRVARRALGYFDTGHTFSEIGARMKSEIEAGLTKKFGAPQLVLGNKAIRLKGASGSRGELDIVPMFRLHTVLWDASHLQYFTREGVAFFPVNGPQVMNFPDQHNKNGIAKRDRTKRRFKKIVRMLKRLRDELASEGTVEAQRAPSFLVECLVYGVEDTSHSMKESLGSRLDIDNPNKLAGQHYTARKSSGDMTFARISRSIK